MSYRAHAALARNLAINGVSSLRFHCAGVGNSGGESLETTLDTFVNDTIDAVDWLTARHDDNVVGVVGTRLGGTIATLAAEKHPLVTILGVHTPVVSGDDYWGFLLKARQITEITRGEKPKSKRQLIEELTAQGRIEIHGDLWNEEFVRSLRCIDLEQRTPASISSLMLTAVSTDTRAKSATTMLAERYHDTGSDAQLWEDQREFWTPKSFQDGYLPLGYVQQTVSWLSRQST